MSSDFLPGITSVASNALLLSSTLELLQQIEALPSGATGAMTFGDEGLILIENKRICWAVATDMRQRLIDLLCQQRDPPVPRAALEELFRRCKQENKPISQALVASGFINETDLRNALERHNCEAIMRLAQSHTTTPTRFTRHAKQGYDPRFVFTTAEVLAALAGKRRTQLATLARQRLSEQLVPDARGFAFLRDPRTAQAMVIAVDHECDLGVLAALEVAAWSTRAFDVAFFVDPNTQIVAGTWCERNSLLAWREGDIYYAALCPSRAASALLLSQLARRMRTVARGAEPAPPG
ncbi:MAG TPA: hypothetical protein VFZ61_09185, partial [Polyangiales bacterium]